MTSTHDYDHVMINKMYCTTTHNALTTTPPDHKLKCKSSFEFDPTKQNNHPDHFKKNTNIPIKVITGTKGQKINAITHKEH